MLARHLLITTSLTNMPHLRCSSFFHDAATTEIYTLSLHDALPIFLRPQLALDEGDGLAELRHFGLACDRSGLGRTDRSEEHTSELQSRENLVCRLLLEKKKYPSVGLRRILRARFSETHPGRSKHHH